MSPLKDQNRPKIEIPWALGQFRDEKKNSSDCLKSLLLASNSLKMRECFENRQFLVEGAKGST